MSSASSGLRHWGSSLSLSTSEDGSAFNITSRVLRPAHSSTMSRGSTPAREATTTTQKKWLPAARRTEAKHPELEDYLRKPRLVNTLGCLSPPPQTPLRPSDLQSRLAAAEDRPVYRNLRLGGFFENEEEEEELYPETLRQYYRDTFLDDFDRENLRAYDESAARSDGPGCRADRSTRSCPIGRAEPRCAAARLRDRVTVGR